eukprot:419801-Rhodomonas_salina.4
MHRTASLRRLFLSAGRFVVRSVRPTRERSIVELWRRNEVFCDEFGRGGTRETHHLMTLVVNHALAADLTVSNEERLGLRPALLQQRLALLEALQVHFARNLRACVSVDFERERGGDEGVESQRMGKHERQHSDATARRRFDRG